LLRQNRLPGAISSTQLFAFPRLIRISACREAPRRPDAGAIRDNAENRRCNLLIPQSQVMPRVSVTVEIVAHRLDARRDC
jgi:hypothetical protein